MDKKIPKVFANQIDKKIENNRTYYVSNDEDRSIKEAEISNVDINKKLKDIFNSTRYVYRAEVVITLKDRVITKKIIGKNNNQLITIDNEIIPISDILDIKFKD